MFLTSSELQIRIKDDGVGFTVDKQKATELFYQQNVKDSLKHSGMIRKRVRVFIQFVVK